MSHEDYIFEDPCESMDRSQEEEYSDYKDAMFEQECFDEAVEPDGTVVGTSQDKLYYYIYKGISTRKAQFFITDEDYSNGCVQRFGFWCPHSAIKRDSGNNAIIVAHWCDITHIEFR